ncbi:hypothetical protein QO207_28015 [Pseudomonas sp. CAN2814]|uniref:hypothetical protein n=1 Tax=Pseudomonas sp. CAN1 TaxID=3046726 RepID=UPI0026476335|nr:hypothetical protein [Pseudomonas sp. CAN1]MDN6860455.1 hypothetical protein [Pseudomonas sp. CAN1]
MTTYDDDLRSALAAYYAGGLLAEGGRADEVFREIGEMFPFVGSKIKWAMANDVVQSKVSGEMAVAESVDFFCEVTKWMPEDEIVTYVGDSATTFSITGRLSVFWQAVHLIVDVPQHHYFLGRSSGWCVSLTMEGDMNFGFSSVI